MGACAGAAARGRAWQTGIPWPEPTMGRRRPPLPPSFLARRSRLLAVKLWERCSTPTTNATTTLTTPTTTTTTPTRTPASTLRRLFPASAPSFSAAAATAGRRGHHNALFQKCLQVQGPLAGSLQGRTRCRARRTAQASLGGCVVAQGRGARGNTRTDPRLHPGDEVTR